MSWVDEFRGIAIILVVMGHVIGGLLYSQFVSESERRQLDIWYRWIYSFHMPSFFAASGLFALGSLRRAGPRAFISEKMRTLAYPYLVWGLITWACHNTMARFTNTEPDPFTPLKLLYNPASGPWFLYALFALMLLLACWDSIGGKLLGFVFLAAGAYVLRWCVQNPLPSVADPVCAFGIYFALAVGLRDHVLRAAHEAESLLLLLVLIGSFGLQTAIIVEGSDHLFGPGFLLAICGMAGLFAVSVLLARFLHAGFLQLCGRQSLEIYLLSGLAAVPARLVLHRGLGVTAALPHLLVGSVAGVLIPLAFASLCDAFGMTYLFRWGRSERLPALASLQASSGNGVLQRGAH
jgi:fucose 4-O-acetylase-like acetyltransferase